MARETPSIPDLRVDVAALRRKGVDRHHVAVDLPVAWLAQILADTDAEVSDPGHVELDLQLPIDGPVLVGGTLDAHFDVPCGRCLDPARVSASTRLSATFVPASSVSAPVASGPNAADADEGEEGLGLSADDLDTWTYADTTVDLSLVVVEHLKIAYPMRALCSRGEACRGLCSNCGANLNEHPAATRCAACGRELPPVDGGPAPDADRPESPLAAALKKLQLPD